MSAAKMARKPSKAGVSRPAAIVPEPATTRSALIRSIKPPILLSGAKLGHVSSLCEVHGSRLQHGRRGPQARRRIP